MNEEVLMPTDTQINNALCFGWEYLGDGLFSKGDDVGYFTMKGFKKENTDEC